MTKKDYELFANQINSEHMTPEQFEAVVGVCIAVFKRDNYAFNQDKFEEACHTGKHIRKSIKERIGG